MSVPPDHGAAEDVETAGTDSGPAPVNPYGAGWGKGWGASWAGIPEMENPDQSAPVARFAEPAAAERVQPQVLGDIDLPSVPESFAFPTADHRPGDVMRTVGRALGALAVLAAVSGLIFWLVNRTPSTPQAGAGDVVTTATTTPPTATVAAPARDAGAEAQLLRMVPAGYPPGACEAVDPEPDSIAKVNCDNNIDPGGPTASTYLLVDDPAALDGVLTAAVRRDAILTCPGNIQSPGPWRRNATPQKASGTLVCGIDNGIPTVAWTDVERMVVSVVRADSPGPTLDQLYQWWASHS